ncbi:MAG: LytTR family DNA-binding domain-containing protein [Bacteroidetes bacterium]|nr:LytTR family DNA-binding domain-containing protein [Bacteroidota bacterium]
MNCLIVDDDRGSAKLIENYISKTNFLNLSATCTSAIEAREFLADNAIDLIFLDIEMPEMSGLDLAETIDKNTQVIFMSAQATYAVKAFEIDVTDYLHKPISYNRFLDSVQRAKRKKDENAVNEIKSRDHIFVKTDHQLVKIRYNDIKWIEAMSDYVMIYTLSSRYIVLSSLKSIEEKLPPKQFLRSHRSFVVNVDRITSIDDSTVLIEDKSIPLGKTFKVKFLEAVRTF